jgi:diacylglycerol O-acyltransferase
MPIDRLSALDQFMLATSRMWPQDIGALCILDGRGLLDESGRLELDAIRRAIAARLHLVSRFRQVVYRPRRGLGRSLWVDAPGFDLASHVRELPLEPPVGEPELLATVEHLRRQALDASRPMWEMWFLTGLPEGRVGLFVKVHHAIADGMAAMTTVAAFLDPDPAVLPQTEVPWRPESRPSTRALLADNVLGHLRAAAGVGVALMQPRATLRGFRAALAAIRELLAGKPATKTSIDRMVGPDRALALIATRLDPVREIGRAHDGTVNDVLLAVTAGGLRALLRSRGEAVDDTIVRTYVPVSLRRRLRGPQQGNLIGQMAVPLDLGEQDADRRLRTIAAETTRQKAMTRPSLGTLMGGRVMRWLLLPAVVRQRVNVTTASIPGPKVPLYFAAARLLQVFPVLPLVANEPLGVGALSYAGGLYVGITADRDAFPDVEVFAEAVREQLHGLGAPTDPVFQVRVGRAQGSSTGSNDGASLARVAGGTGQ